MSADLRRKRWKTKKRKLFFFEEDFVWVQIEKEIRRVLVIEKRKNGRIKVCFKDDSVAEIKSLAVLRLG